MIKICYIIGQLAMAGGEKQLFQLIRSIDRDKFSPVVISLSRDGYWGKEIRKLNVQLIEIPRKKSREFSRLFRLVRVLHGIKPQIVHTYLVSGNFYGRIAAILLRVPVIVASERSLPEIGKDKNVIRFWIDKFLGLFTHAIICNSEKASSALLSNMYDPEKVFTVHNGIDATGSFANVSGGRNIPTRTVIGTVGRLYSYKNHRLFLDMARSVLDKYKDRDIQFMIVGDGPLNSELKDYAELLMIGRNVIFAGERFDIPELLRSMDIFVMTSIYEGLPNSVMEAMSVGLPVVATDVGGMGELIVDKITGLLCPPNNVHELAEAISYLIDNEEAARSMGKRGTERILKEFTVAEMALSTERIYERILTKKQLLGVSSDDSLRSHL